MPNFEPWGLQMKRREFIARLGAAGAYAAVPRLVLAQQDTRVRRLVALFGGDADRAATNPNVARLRNELAKLGWVEGRNLQIDVRYGRGDSGPLAAAAEEGAAVIVVEQHPHIALQWSARAYVMQRGSIQLAGSSAALVDKLEEVTSLYL